MADTKIIYTVNIGGYDKVESPVINSPQWKYIAITDSPDLICPGWEVLIVPAGDAHTSREIKINPWKYFNFDKAIYVDGNIQPSCNLDDFVVRYHKDGITVRLHPVRSCVYEEAKAVIRLKKDKTSIVNLQMQKYEQVGYPRNNGLGATGIMILSNKEEIKELCKVWWSEVKMHSYRDQLSFNYASWKTGVSFNTMPHEVLFRQFIYRRPHYETRFIEQTNLKVDMIYDE